MRPLLPLLLTLGAAWAAALPAPLQSVTHPNARWAVHVDARRAVAVDYDGAAAVLVPRQGSPRAVRFPGNSKLRAPLVTPDGRVLAVGLDFEKCQAAVWDVTAGQKVAALRGALTRVLDCGRDTEFIFDIQFTPDGRFLLTADQTGLRRWDARSGKLLGALPGQFLSLKISTGGRSVATVGAGYRVELWAADLSRRLKALPQQPADCLRGPGAWPSGIAWSTDSTKLAFSCNREVRVWKVAVGGVMSLEREGKREYSDAPVFSPDGRFVVADEDQLGVAVWQANSGQRVRQFRPDSPQAQVTDVKVTPGGLLLAALSDGRLARLDLNQPARVLPPLSLFSENGKGLWPSLAVSRGGDRLAVASGDGRLSILALPGK